MRAHLRKIIVISSLIGVALVILAIPAIKAHLPKSDLIYHTDFVALEGYDLVSYFSGPSPVKGRAEFSLEHKGLRYFFSSQDHLNQFQTSPEAFLPQYGAWCATAMASGLQVTPDTKNFVIEDGKLFLFFQYLGVNAKNKWVKSSEELKPKADQNWRELLSSSSL